MYDHTTILLKQTYIILPVIRQIQLQFEMPNKIKMTTFAHSLCSNFLSTDFYLKDISLLVFSKLILSIYLNACCVLLLGHKIKKLTLSTPYRVLGLG